VTHRLLCAAFALTLLAGPVAARTGLDASLGPEGVTILDDSKPVLFYRTKSANPGTEPGRLNYIHPLYAPDGTVLTEDRPAGRPSERGAFWAWQEVLLNGQVAGYGASMNGLTWFVRRTRYDGQADGSGVLTLDVDWISHARPELIYLASETTLVHVFPMKGGVRRIEVDTTVTPRVDGLAVAGDVASRNNGGFTLRLVHPERLVFGSSGATVQPASGPVSAGDAMGFAWTGDGPAWAVGMSCKADGAALTRWVLDRAGAQNCAFAGRDPVAIYLGHPLRLQTTLTIRPRRR
jgi:hypothetical protein